MSQLGKPTQARAHAVRWPCASRSSMSSVIVVLSPARFDLFADILARLGR